MELRAIEERNKWGEEMLGVESRHGERYERLLREYRVYKENQQRQVDELSEQLKAAQDKASKLEEDVASGLPQGQLHSNDATYQLT